MELKINELVIPESPQFNFEELKNELTERVQFYETLVYTDENIKEAKADKASLNKLRKAMNDERIRLEREYMEPFNKFKEQINELIAIIDRPIALIDEQVKEYDQQKKAEKEKEIQEHWNSTDHPEWLRLDMIFNPKWLNATYSMKNIAFDISEWIGAVNCNIATLAELPDFSFEATEVYKTTLDFNKAISEGRRLSELQKRKEETLEKIEKGEPISRPPEPEQDEIIYPELAEWVRFAAYITTKQAKKLKAFCEAEGIQIKSI